jgi:hypothetical protein
LTFQTPFRRYVPCVVDEELLNNLRNIIFIHHIQWFYKEKTVGFTEKEVRGKFMKPAFLMHRLPANKSYVLNVGCLQFAMYVPMEIVWFVFYLPGLM